MSIIAMQTKRNSEKDLIPAGTHAAYLYRVIDLGTQSKSWDGKVVEQPKIWLDFEFPKLVVEYEDKETKEKKSFIRTSGSEYTLSLSEKGKLLPMLQSWLGRNLTEDELKSFELTDMLGRPAFVTIAHNAAKNGNTYANIASVAPIMDGYEMPMPTKDAVEISKAEWGGEAFQSLPEFLRKKIEESKEYRISLSAGKLLGGEYEEIPTVETEKKPVEGIGGDVPF